MKISIKNTRYCVACEFWDDVGRTAMSPTFSSRIWDIKEKEERMCLKRHLRMPARGSCQKYECKLKGLL